MNRLGQSPFPYWWIQESEEGGGHRLGTTRERGRQDPIRDFPDHATFREMGAKLVSADNLGVFLCMTLCNNANFEPYNKSNVMALKKCETGKQCMDCPLFLI